MKEALFITCNQGIEPLLQLELEELGIKNTRTGFRGVFVYDFDWKTIYCINYSSRLASRVLLPLCHFQCRNKQSLYEAVQSIQWQPFFRKNKTFVIDANVKHTQLRHSLFAAQIMKDAICDQLRAKTGSRPSVDLENPDIRLNLFIHQQEGIISFDTSGEPLYKRGYRLHTGKAPLQETLAAALLRIANYHSDLILCDPCCGSGTLLVEAAMVASKTAPGFIRREWGFMRHPEYSSTEWLKEKNEKNAQRIPLKPQHFFGCDKDSHLVQICKSNLRAIGFHKEIEITENDFNDYMPPVLPNLVITNPPHGKRLESEEELKPLYRQLGDFMKRKIAKPGKGFIFTGSLELAKEVGLTPKKRHVLFASGEEARFLEFEIY